MAAARIRAGPFSGFAMNATNDVCDCAWGCFGKNFLYARAASPGEG
jgi:hypothetical protein